MSTPTFRAQPPDADASVDDTIERLKRAEVQTHDLSALSDLSREDARALTDAWPGIPLEARLAAVRRMAELSEDRIDLSFGRALRVALGDPSPIIRQLAIDALWEDDQDDLLPWFRRTMRADESVDVRAAAAQGLARFAEQLAQGRIEEDAGENLRQELVSVAGDSRIPQLVRRRALESLAVFGVQPDVVDLIREAYDADDESVRAGALNAMGRTLDQRWLNVLLAELESPDAEMRFEAARACGELGDASAVAGLERCGRDPDSEVRQAAIVALGRIGSQAAVRSLHQLAESARPADREAIEEALHEATSDDDLR